MVTQIKTPKFFPLWHENKPLIALDEDDGGKCKQEWVCQIGQVPTEPKTQTSQENDKYNDSKPFISSHFTKLFHCAWIASSLEYKVEFTAAQEKSSRIWHPTKVQRPI